MTLVYVTMSLHKLTAGSGYDYLTRQVAAFDSTEKGHTGLASYYTEKGESPGTWIGSGMAGIDGLETGDVVTADHLQSLFGSGHHPLAAERVREFELRIGRPGVASPTKAEYLAATRLGIPYKVYKNDVSAFQVEVAKRMSAFNEAAGLPGDWPVPAAERASIRTHVAREFFTIKHGREPVDAREVAATIAKHSRPKTQAVAGYDLTFSPVKSVSVLWALSDPSTAAVIERAHRAAIDDALAFIETKALFTREGTDGARQVNVRGLVATAFTHRDSRAGDPDLHTHVAVANKVQTRAGGKWLAIDGRLMFKAKVSASETYNTALERHLSELLGLRFEERPNADARKRPVREIVGVDGDLNARFSKRRHSVEARRKELAADFQRTHGRPATPVETLHLAQRATLETRDAKHEPRTLAQQREAWHAEALQVMGSRQRLRQMLRSTLQPQPGRASLTADSAWVAAAADRIVATMEGSRATWQYWHVYAEAQRQVRAAQTPTDHVVQLVGLLVDEVLEDRSVRITQPFDSITEPVQLRRVDGSSVYVVAGVHLFTSATVLAAEERLVAAASLFDGFIVPESCVELSLLESAANGVTLNAGQATLVRQMATSGARLQLAIAPAGSGKTTAMRALAGAWTDGGGKVVGLAPSAAAADALRSSIGSRIGTQTDTLAKLTHSLSSGKLPAWVYGIDSSTLVVIDEAGMADTLGLDSAVQFVLARGGSVRLVGDDQQLAAIGAGGVLRDIRAQQGAVQLSELVRFRDPAEGAASLALREGQGEALGFYLDRQRVHVGDLATMTEDLFGAWQADRAAGLDSVMLAPTRDLVGELNQQARAHRLNRLDASDPSAVGPTRRLADGNEASVGELVITRENDRRLRTSATDWVKNGDRWSVLGVHEDGALTVQHLRHGRTLRLPAQYVKHSTDLGYACTVHTAQGVTADTMHGLATGTESRQQLYTMMTRGAHANHVYLEVVGDGDPHSVIHPALVRPLTPTDILESMLARDDAQQSATSMIREQADPRARLGHAARRYLDSLHFAAEDIIGSTAATAMDAAVEELLPGLTDEPAWPALRAHLLLLGASGVDPVAELSEATSDQDLDTAGDRAAVLDWRLDPSGMRNTAAGPLPWMPAVPSALAEHPQWAAYLSQRADLVADLAGRVHQDATTSNQAGRLPSWAENGLRPDANTIADVEVWRGAMGVEATDRRPTGPPRAQKATARWQRDLNRRLAGDHTPALTEWRHLLLEVAPQVRTDEFTPLLAERLAAMSRAGLATHQLLRGAAAAGALPDDHAAAALWWRMSRHLTPALATQIGNGSHGQAITATWTAQLAALLGLYQATQLKTSTWWPALVSNLEHALQRGWQLEDLLLAGSPPSADTNRGGQVGQEIEECLALVWRTSVALDPIPDALEYPDPNQEPPEDLWDGVEPQNRASIEHAWSPDPAPAADPDDLDEMDVPETQPDRFDPATVERDLLLARLRRPSAAVELEPTGAQLRSAYQRAREWDDCPVTRERLIEVNTLTHRFFQAHLAGSWAQLYLAYRFGDGLTNQPHIPAGRAPAGWTNLVAHLRGHGISEEEMLAAGVATRARTGRLIDRFRDRVMFPIEHHGDVIGFVGRRRPELGDDDKGGPKYLNTATTALFHKGDQLFVADPRLLKDGATPVLVEGPMDAYAVTLAGEGRYAGVATLGTSLTKQQAAQLARINRDPIVATDPDVAGQVAAERDYWLLTPHGLDPTHARFPQGLDPADVLTQRGPSALAAALDSAASLGQVLLEERTSNMDPAAALLEAVQVLAARRPNAWEHGVQQLGERLYVGDEVAARFLRDAVETWDADPRTVAADKAASAGVVRARLEAAAELPPAQRWAALADELDARLVHEPDWPATATMLQQSHEAGHDIPDATRAMVTDAPLGGSPTRDLRYRIVASLNVTADVDESLPTAPATQRLSGNKDARADHRHPHPTPEHQNTGPHR